MRAARYFLICYSGNHPDGHYNGQLDWTSNDGSFVNRKLFQEHVEKEYSVTNAVVSNIIELSLQDFEQWKLK